MKHYYCCVLLFSGLSLSCFSQEVQSSVIAPAGETSSTSNLVLDWTIGEPVIETAKSSSSFLTQGFHQPFLKVQKVIPPGGPAWVKNAARVFPNPTSGSINIQLDQALEHTLLLTLVDANGKLLANYRFPGGSTALTIDIRRFSQGMYYLRLAEANGTVHGEYKIIKVR